MSLSPQNSVSSTTSNLLKKARASDSFKNIQQEANADRSKLTSMLETYNKSGSDELMTAETVNSTTEDDYTDADDFIANMSRSEDSLPAGQSSSAQVPKIIHPAQQTVVFDNATDQDDDADTTIGSQQFEFEKPTRPRPQEITFVNLSSDESRSSGDSPMPNSPTMNRRSMISEYAASIHEVKQVAYMVDPEDEPQQTELQQPQQHQQAVEMVHKPSVVRINRSGSKSSKKTPSVDATHQKKESMLSYDSSTTQSGSGSSKYPDSSYSGKDYQYDQTHILPKERQIISEERKTSVDSFDFDVGPLNTKKGEHVARASERQLLTAVDPAIPSRSPRRPVSSIGMHAPTAEDWKQGYTRRTQSDIPANLDSLVNEIKQENSTIATEQKEKQIQFEPSHQRDNSQASTQSKQPRPLPPPPVPQHKVTPSQDLDNEKDDGFVTEDEEDKAMEKKIKKKASKKKKRTSSSGFKKGHFNHDTLVQLLQVTEGTIIGQEFQNIGLEPTDKQLLERLVDSLSRLTADMIIDSERHEESVKRLSKAIKALEGF